MKRKKGSIVSTRASQRSNVAKGKGKVDDEAEKSLQLCPYFDNLPTHLISHILLQLPIKSLLICKCVCKIWKTLISEPQFAKLHFDQAPISFMVRTFDYTRMSRAFHFLEFEPHVKLEPIFKIPLQDAKSKCGLRSAKLVLAKNYENNEVGSEKIHNSCNEDHATLQVVNSCNGLLCLCDPSYKDLLVICNPITGEFIRLPEATTPFSSLDSSRVRTSVEAGFGSLPKTNEYKVIKMGLRRVRRAIDWVFEPALQVHTLGTPSWRNVDVDPHICILSPRYPTCVNNVLHWVMFGSQQMSMLCFNFENERLQSFPSPPDVCGNNRNHRLMDRGINMGELKGFLYICHTCSLHDVTMWVMKTYGIGESWTKVYNIDTSISPLGNPGYFCNDFCWPVRHFEEGACILVYHSCNCLIYYEPKKYEFKFFKFHGARSKLVNLIPHIPSLISLKDVVKGDNIEVLNIHSRYAEFKLVEQNDVLSLS